LTQGNKIQLELLNAKIEKDKDNSKGKVNAFQEKGKKRDKN